MAMTQQRGAFGGGGMAWMPRPQQIPACPPGLEYLTQIDQLIVKQQVTLLEVFVDWEQKNNYTIFNSLGQQVYFAHEESSCLMRQCCGPSRGFNIVVADNTGQVVMQIKRSFKCCAGCCWCACSDHCAFRVEVQGPNDELYGYVRQQKSCWKPTYSIYTADDQELAGILGPCCICSCPGCMDVEFPVSSAVDGSMIGQVAKQWTGAVKEMFTDADTFNVTFPLDMDVKMKATMLGALFLIDFMYFEKPKNDN